VATRKQQLAFLESEMWRARTLADRELRRLGHLEPDIDTLARSADNVQALMRMAPDDARACMAAEVLVCERELSRASESGDHVDVGYWAARLVPAAGDLELVKRFKNVPLAEWRQQSGQSRPRIDGYVAHGRSHAEGNRKPPPRS